MFVYNSFNNVISKSDHTASNDQRWKQLWSNFKWYSEICLGGLDGGVKKTPSARPNQNLNWSPPE
jgi:hypothetical protein